MSIALMSRVWTLNLPHDQQSILMALADHAHDDGSKCFPGVDYLAWKTGYGRRSVQRILRSIEMAGIARPVAYLLGGRGHAREYILDLEKGVIKSPFRTEERAPSATQRAPSATQRATQGPPQPSVTIKNRTSRAREVGDAAHFIRKTRGLRSVGEILASA